MKGHTDWIPKEYYFFEGESPDIDGLQYVTWQIGRGDIRVKYLDKEDIESLGFEDMMDSFNEHIGKNQYKATSRKGGFNKLKWLSKHDDKICLHFVDDFKDDGNNNCYVAFTIKNKSELKKVLKMIGYE